MARAVLCGAFLFAAPVPPVSAQSTGGADIAAIRASTQALAAGLGRPDMIRRTEEVSLDLMFLFQEMQNLQSSLPLVADLCGQGPLTLEALGRTDCLSGLIDAERRAWRVSAEIAAQLHQVAGVSLATRLPPPTVPEKERTNESRREVELWWRSAAPTAFEAVSRIGREWMKHRGSEAPDRALRRIARALQQIEREPAIAQLRNALGQEPDYREMNNALKVVVDPDKTLEDRAEAAMQFAAAYANAQAVELETLFSMPVTEAVCLERLPVEMIAATRVDGALCVAAFERLAEAAQAEAGEVLNGAFGALAREVTASARQDTAFTAALTEAFEARILTLRLMLAKVEAIPAEVESCAEAARLMAAADVTENARRGGLDRQRLRLMSERLSAVARVCGAQAVTDQLDTLCDQARDAISGPALRLERALADAPRSLPGCPRAGTPGTGPECARDRMQVAWERFVKAVDVPQIAEICKLDPDRTLADWQAASDKLGEEGKAALDALVEGALATIREDAIDDVRTALDRIRIPAEIAEGVDQALAGLCRISDPGLDRAGSVARQLGDAVLAEVGLLIDGKRAEELEPLCSLVARGEPVLSGAELSDIAVQALGDEEDQRIAAANRVLAALKTLGDKGDGLIGRLSTAAIVLEGAALLDNAVALAGEEVQCGPTGGPDRLPGFDMGILSKGVTRSLTVEEGTWAIRIEADLELAICGERATSADQLQQVLGVATVTARLSETIVIGEETSPDAVRLQLSDAMRKAVAEARIEADPDKVAAQLKRIVQASGLRMQDFGALNLAPLEDARFDPDHGLQLRFAVPDPVNRTYCLSVPMSEPAADCPSFEEADKVARDIALALAEAAIEDLLTQIAPVFARGVAEIDAATELRDLFSEHAEASVVRRTHGGEVVTGLRISVSASAFRSLTDDLGLPELRGAYVFDLVPSDRGIELVHVKAPTFDSGDLLRAALGGVPDELLVFTEVGEPGKPPQGMNLSGRNREPCLNAYVHRVDFGSTAPMRGQSGYFCLRPEQPDPWLVVDGKVSVTSVDGSWQLALRGVTQDSADTDVFELEVLVTSRSPLFDGLRRVEGLIEVTLRDGHFTLPSDRPENAELYAYIERSLSAQMPRGVRIHGVRLSTRGIDISIDPSGAAQDAWRDLQDMALAQDGPWQDWARDVGAALEEGADYFCNTAAPLLQLGQTIEKGTLVALPEICGGAVNSEGTIRLRGPELIEWACSAAGVGAGSPVSDCYVTLPEELNVCGRNINLDFVWAGDGGNREVTSRELRDCLEDQVEALLPEEVVSVEGVELGFEGTCASSMDLADCAVIARIEVSLEELIADYEVMGADLLGRIGGDDGACQLTGGTLWATGVVSLDGMVRFGSGDAGLDALESQFRACAQALAAAAAEVALNEVSKELGSALSLDELYDALAQGGGTVLDGTRHTLDATLGGDVACRLKGRDADCGALTGPDVRDGTVTGAEMVAQFDWLDQRLALKADFGWNSTLIDAGDLSLDFSDGDDPADQVRTQAVKWAERQWRHWADPADARLSLSCPGTQDDDCLNELARKLARSLSGEVLRYEGGATLSQNDTTFVLSLPFIAQLDLLDLRANFVLRCTLDVKAFPKVGAPECDTKGANPEDLVMQALANALGQSGVLNAGDRIDLAILELTIVTRPAYDPVTRKIAVTAEAGFANLGLSETVPARITLDRNLKVDVDVDAEVLASKVTEQLASAINDLVGDYGIEIIKLYPRPLSGGLPTELVIESQANIAGFFAISAPTVVLSDNGLNVEGPNRFAIAFPDGISIPIPPIAICPNGGAIEDTKLSIFAAITVGECSASYLLNYRGSVTVDIERPLRVETEGSLTLLSIIPLGSNEGLMDLGIPLIEQRAEIGGAVSDIFAMRSEFKMDGRTLTVEADGDVKVFRAPVGAGTFLLDLDEGILDSTLMFDVGFAKGDGAVRTQSGFSRPEAMAKTSMSVAGFDAFAADLMARTNLLRTRLSVLGLRLTVVFPGLDALNPDKIADLIKDLLTPNFENLDKALAALLSGNVTINPFGDFGSGGDGMGGDGDGDMGESAEGTGASDPGDGLGDSADAPAPDQGVPAVVPPGGTPGILGVKTAELWFLPLQGDAAGLVQIGTGPRGTPDEEKVAVARIADGHFAPDGKPLGRTLSLLPAGYSQLQGGTIAEGGGCAAGRGDIVYLYSGDKVARRGFYEPCRITGPDGRPLSGLSNLDAELRRDIIGFHGALISEMGVRPEEPDGDYGRLMLRARIVDAQADHGLRGMIGFQRVDELLIAMRGALDPEAACGTSAAPVPGGEMKSKIFWLTGMRKGDIDNPETVLQSVRALWNCDEGTLARFDPESKRLATAEILSKSGEKGFERVSKMDPPIDPPVTPPPWCCGGEDPEPTPVPPTPTPIPPIIPCETGCTSGVRFGPESEFGCGVWIDDRLSGRFAPGNLGGEGCAPGESARALSAVPGGYYPLVLPGAENKARLALAHVESGFHVTASEMAFVTGMDFVPAQSDMMNGFLRVYGRADPSGLKSARLLSISAQIEALEGPHPSGGRLWSLRSEHAAWTIRQAGNRMDDARATAAVGVLTKDVRAVEVLDDARMLVERPTGLWPYRWTGERWEALAEVLRRPGTAMLERDVALELYDRIPQSPETYHKVRIVDYDPAISAWAYAIGDANGVPGRMVIRRAVGKEMVIGEKRHAGLTADAPEAAVQETGEESLWVDLDVPRGSHRVQVSLSEFAVRADPYICVYTPDGNLIASNDDADGRYSRVVWETSGRDPSYVLEVRNFRGGAAPGVRVRFVTDQAVGVRTSAFRKCQTPELLSVPEYFGPDPQVTEITGLALALQREGALLALAGDMLESPDKSGPELFEWVTVDRGGAAVARSLYLAETTGDALLFHRFMPGKDGVDEIGAIARFAATPPPRHAWPALAKELDTSDAPAPTITGSAVTIPGVEVDKAWQTPLPRHEGNGRIVYFLSDGKSRSVELDGAFANDRNIAAAVRYLLETGARRLTLLRNEPPVAEVRQQLCGPGGACAAELVRLALGGQTAVTLPLVLQEPRGAGMESVVSIFARLAEESPDRLNDRLPTGDPWAQPGARVLRLTRDGPAHVIADDGRWACLDLDGALATAPQVRGALANWPSAQLLPAQTAAPCDDPQAVTWRIAAARKASGVGLLYRLGADQPLDLLALSETAPRVTTPAPVRDAMKGALVEALRDRIGQRDDLSVVTPGTAPTHIDPVGLVVLQVTRPGGKLAWVAGFHLPNSDPTVPEPLNCVLGEVSAEVSRPLTEEEKRMMVDLVVGVIDQPDQTACPTVERRSINLVDGSGGPQIWIEYPDRKSPGPEIKSMLQRSRHAQVASPVSPPPVRISYRQFDLFGGNASLRLDTRLFDQLEEPRARAVRDGVQRALLELAKVAGDDRIPDATLYCRPDCRQLVGVTSHGDGMAVLAPQDGQGVRIVVLEDAPRQYPDHVDGLSAGLARVHFADCADALCLARFSLGVAGGAIAAGELPQGKVYARSASGTDLRSLGVLPLTQVTGDLSEVEGAMRSVLLGRIAARGAAFSVTPLVGGEWAEPVAPVLLAFPVGGASLTRHQAVFANGENGPAFHVSETSLPSPFIRTARQSLMADGVDWGASDHQFWMIGAPSGAPVLFSLEGEPERDLLSVLNRLDADLAPAMTFETPCRIPVELGAMTVAGLDRFGASVSAVSCHPVSPGLVFLATEMPEAVVVSFRGAAQVTMSGPAEDIAAGAADRAARLAQMSGPALDAGIGTFEVVATGDGTLIAASRPPVGAERLIWRQAPDLTVERLGGFVGADLEDADHQLLLVDLPGVADFKPRGAFLTVGARQGVFFDGRHLNVPGQQEVIRRFAYLGTDPVSPEDDLHRIAKYLENNADASVPDQSHIARSSGPLVILDQAADLLVRGWVQPAQGDSRLLVTPEAWPEQVPAGEVDWVAGFLLGVLERGKDLRAFIGPEAGVFAACSRASPTSLSLDLGQPGPLDVTRQGEQVLVSLAGRSCDTARRHLGYAVRTVRAKPDYHALHLRPGRSPTVPNLVIAQQAKSDPVQELWGGVTDQEFLCRARLDPEAEVIGGLADWLLSGKAPCDWAIHDAAGKTALVSGQGELAVIAGNRSRSVEATALADEHRLSTLTWFSEAGLKACAARLSLSGPLATGARIIDDPCGSLAIATTADPSFRPLVTRARPGVDPLNAALLERLATVLATSAKPGEAAPFWLDFPYQTRRTVVAIFDDPKASEVLLLGSRGCAWVTLAGTTGVDELARLLEPGLPGSTPRHLQVQTQSLLGPWGAVTLVAQRPDTACARSGRVDMTPPGLVIYSDKSPPWTFRGNRPHVDQAWYPLDLTETPRQVIAGMATNTKVAEYVGHQLRPGIGRRALWFSPASDPAQDKVRYVLTWDSDKVLCFALLHSQDEGAAITRAGFEKAVRQLTSHGYGPEELIEALNTLEGGTPNERWYEPLAADPRGLLVREAAPGCPLQG
ncbi:hypothetical protein A9320_18690 [Ruegeria sp. PBVC088]|nr:hypothetical protein A9320_18690 [Ruegeria sp. PBVC088]